MQRQATLTVMNSITITTTITTTTIITKNSPGRLTDDI